MTKQQNQRDGNYQVASTKSRKPSLKGPVLHQGQIARTASMSIECISQQRSHSIMIAPDFSATKQGGNVRINDDQMAEWGPIE